MTTALLIIDVQEALCSGEYAGFEVDRIVSNINSVSRRVREKGGYVVIIQHESPTGPFAYQSKGWMLPKALVTDPRDIFIRKTASDSFHNTALQAELQQRGVTQLIVCGMQSEFCVDSTTRRALALGFPVTLIGDGHTTMDSAVLKASQITAHHNDTLTNVTSFGPAVTVLPAAKVFI